MLRSLVPQPCLVPCKRGKTLGAGISLETHSPIPPAYSTGTIIAPCTARGAGRGEWGFGNSLISSPSPSLHLPPTTTEAVASLLLFFPCPCGETEARKWLSLAQAVLLGPCSSRELSWRTQHIPGGKQDRGMERSTPRAGSIGAGGTQGTPTAQGANAGCCMEK